MENLDDKAIKRGWPYRIDFPDGTPSLYVGSVDQAARVARELYPDVKLNIVDIRIAGKASA
jgi:hypothetical protein